MAAVTIEDLNNAKLDVDHIDRVATSPAATSTDRLGHAVPTLAALTAEFPQAAANAAQSVVQAQTAVNAAQTAVGAANTALGAVGAALIQAGVYVDEPTGRAAVADGTAFKVQGSGDVAAYEYRRVDASSSTLIAAYPAAKAVYAPGLLKSQPNLFLEATVDIESNLDRYVNVSAAQATVTASSVLGLPCWRVQAAAGQVQSWEHQWPVALFAAAGMYSASLRMVAVDAASGGSGNRLVRVLTSQRDGSGNAIAGTTVTIDVATSAGSAIEVPVVVAGQILDPGCVNVRLRVEVQNANGASARNAYVRDMLVAAGPVATFRRPIDTRASAAEAIAGVDTRKIVTPAGLGAALASALTVPNSGIASNALDIAAMTEALTSARVEPPAGLAWDSDSHPLYIYKTPTQYKVLSGQSWLRGFVSPAIWSATPYYVDATKADNTGDGLTPASAKHDISAAITSANVDGQAAMCIYVAAATGNAYYQARSINGAAGTVEPTKPCALIATGGRVRHWAGTNEAGWVNDASGTNTYTGGPASAVRVFDRVNLTNGLYTELTAVADQPAVRATAGSWADVGATLAVRRTDGLAPTVDNTLVLRNINVAALDSCTTDLYIEGFDFEGGPFGALWCDPLASRNIVLNSCTFRYAGNSVNMLDGLRVRRTAGLVLAYNCSADSNWKDGFNYHTDSGGQMYVLQINCTSQDNGRAGSTSNNGVTTHDSVILIDINGDHGPTNGGAVFHCIEDTRTWCVGTQVESDNGGDSNAAAFKFSNNAIAWLQGTTATAPDAGDYALYAQGAAGKIHKRNHTTAAGIEFADPGAVIDTF